jgi:hypothetical protein
VDTAVYDLVTDSDEGLKRIQIKTTRKKDKGRWYVQITRNQYDRKLTANAGGKRRQVPYTAKEIDYFFIVTKDHDFYLIPIEAVEGKGALTLDLKYGEYKVS